MDVNFSPINSGYINSFRYLNIGEIPYIYMKFGENSPIYLIALANPINKGKFTTISINVRSMFGPKKEL